MNDKVIQISVSQEVHSKFKSSCALHGQSIKEALKELIHYYIDNPKPELKDASVKN